MDVQKAREAFERRQAKVLNMPYKELKARFDENFRLFGARYNIGSINEKEWNLWLEAWQAAKAQAVPEGYVLVKVSDRDQEMLELIDQRDHMESQAEELKDKLQALYGVDFGEHSSCNFPFQNAIDYDDSDLVLVPKEPTEETLTNMTNAPIVVNHLCDNADIFLSEDEARIAYKAAIKAQEQNG